MTKEALIDRPAGTDGSTVNIRKSASKSSALVDRIAFGETVEVIDDAGEWCLIRTRAGKTGWVMSNYILYAGGDVSADEGLSLATRETLQMALEKVDSLQKSVVEIGDLIGSVIGRG